MEENTVVAFRNPSDFQDDPLTEVLRAGRVSCWLKPWKLKLPSFWEGMRRWLMTVAVAGLSAMATCRNG